MDYGRVYENNENQLDSHTVAEIIITASSKNNSKQEVPPCLK